MSHTPPQTPNATPGRQPLLAKPGPTRSAMLAVALIALCVALCLALLSALWLFTPTAPISIAASPSTPNTPALVEAGRYLATLGNCQHCHTPRGQPAYSGGRAFATPFGTVYSSNLTPSAQGLGHWNAADFYRALHHGQAKDGRWLYPAFPFPNTTHITRADSDALFAYLQSLPASTQQPPPHQVRWPYNTQAALKVWRTLYFQLGPDTTAGATSASTSAATTTPTATPLQRGAYLVNGLGHCSACHAPRNALGGHADMLSLHGGLMPMVSWYAPSLHNPAEGGVQTWPLADTVALLRDGRHHSAVATGPMAEVVQHSTQHWQAADLQAVAVFLQQLPAPASTPQAGHTAAAPSTPAQTTTSAQRVGERLYAKHCASCHGDDGEGQTTNGGQPAHPALAGNRAVTLASPANLVHMVLNGGFGPSTHHHPRPFGMPPFLLVLSDTEVAAVLTYVRTAWGHQAGPVSELDVQRLRGGTPP